MIRFPKGIPETWGGERGRGRGFSEGCWGGRYRWSLKNQNLKDTPFHERKKGGIDPRKLVISKRKESVVREIGKQRKTN